MDTESQATTGSQKEKNKEEKVAKEQEEYSILF